MKHDLATVYHWLMAEIAAHPKTCVFVALGVGAAIGHLI